MENNYSNYNEMLVAFLDGELDSQQSTELLYEIAGNYELQEEMKRLIGLKAIINRSMLTPPPALKAGVFKHVGLPYTISGYRLSAFLTAFYAFLRNKYVASTLLVVLGAFGIYSIVNKVNTPIEDKQIAKEIPMVSSIEETPVADIYSGELAVATEKTADRPIARNLQRQSTISTNPSAPVIADEIIIMQDEVYSERKSANLITANDNIIQSPMAMSLEYPFVIKDSYNANSLFLGSFLNNISVEFKKFHSQSVPNFDIRESQAPLVNNYGIVFNYALNKQHSLGIEFGNENYLIQFEGYEDLQLIRYRKDIDKFFVGMSYKFHPNLYTDLKLQPYGKIFLGGIEIGPLSRLELGTYYYLTDKVKLFVALEGSALLYNNTEWYSTFKYGVNYGVSFGL